jgi:hypothetical protein
LISFVFLFFRDTRLEPIGAMSAALVLCKKPFEPVKVRVRVKTNTKMHIFSIIHTSDLGTGTGRTQPELGHEKKFRKFPHDDASSQVVDRFFCINRHQNRSSNSQF